MRYLVINQKMLCIRSLCNDDISFNFYNIMNLLCDKYRLKFIENSNRILNDAYNKYFVIDDETNKLIVGIGIIYIEHYSETTRECNIKNIIINEKYKNLNLKEQLIHYLKQYSLLELGCIKCNILT